MQYSKREISKWVNFGELPKRKLPTYMGKEPVAMDVFQVIDDTLKVYPDLNEAIKEYVDGI